MCDWIDKNKSKWGWGWPILKTDVLYPKNDADLIREFQE